MFQQNPKQKTVLIFLFVVVVF